MVNCGYPQSVIYKSFFNAKLQGLANKLADSRNFLPSVSTYYSNFDMRNIVKSINQKLKQSLNESINDIFREPQTVSSLKQPFNLLRLLSINRRNPRLPEDCLIVNKKTVSYVHYISNNTLVSKHQITLFCTFGVI